MFKRGFLFVFILLIVYILNAFLNPFPKKNATEGLSPKYGTSFSFEQAKWYGLEGRSAYIDLISNYQFDWIRLSFFWDQMVNVGQQGYEFNNNFEDLIFAIEEAEKRNIKIVIALGAKTPYYPEYHWPKSVSSKVKFGQTIDINHPVAAEILEIDKKVVEALQKYKNISYWQIENEPYLGNINGWKIAQNLLKAQIQNVRNADNNIRPIILNHVGPPIFDNQWRDLLDLLKSGDGFGVNAYFKTQGIDLFAFSLFNQEIHIAWPKWLVWPVQSWLFLSPNYQAIRKEVESKGVNFMVLEMQSEPYIRNAEDARRKNHYFKASDILKADKFLRSQKVNSIGLWGANYWQYREKNGDSSWSETIKLLVNTRQ